MEKKKKESAHSVLLPKKMVTWPDEHAAISWVIAKEPSYPLFRLMLCFDIP